MYGLSTGTSISATFSDLGSHLWQEKEGTSPRSRDWSEADKEKQEVDSRDEVKRIRKNDQLYVERILLVAEQE